MNGTQPIREITATELKQRIDNGDDLQIVDVREDKAFTAKGSKFRHLVRVEVHLRNGKIMERTVEAGRGNEHNFASEADVVEKFEKLAGHVLPRTKVEQLRDAMLSLEKLQDAATLPELMALA